MTSVGLYLRLSREDEGEGESGSITAQRRIIGEYLSAAPDMTGVPVWEFCDDGFSGTDFDRPGIRGLLEAVRRGEIYCVVVKDFSRFGRRYLEVSRWIEQIFPALGVRFISVCDGYDSDRHKGTTAELDVPVRNMINALYSRDISIKVKSAKRAQLQKGIYSNAFAPYGYRKDEADPHRLLIDEPAAGVVRRIFALAAGGLGALRIARALNAGGIVPPSVYKQLCGSKLAVGSGARTVWISETVSCILRDERYTGTLVGGRHETLRVGSGQKRHTPPEAWIRVPGALPAIVTREAFDALALRRKSRADAGKPDTARPLYRKVRCGVCRHLLRYKGKGSEPYYSCDTAKYLVQNGCGQHRVYAHGLLDALRAAAQTYVAVSTDFGAARCGQSQELDPHHGAAVSADRLDSAIRQIPALKRGLYERYQRGALDKAAFLREREALEAELRVKTAERDALRSAPPPIEPLPPDSALPALSDPLLHALVQQVYTYGTDRIEICFSFRDPIESALQTRCLNPA